LQCSKYYAAAKEANVDAPHLEDTSLAITGVINIVSENAMRKNEQLILFTHLIGASLELL
jgi:hypothetical protein